MATCIHGTHWNGAEVFWCPQCAADAAGGPKFQILALDVPPRPKCRTCGYPYLSHEHVDGVGRICPRAAFTYMPEAEPEVADVNASQRVTDALVALGLPSADE